jgi:hypothetical protein
MTNKKIDQVTYYFFDSGPFHIYEEAKNKRLPEWEHNGTLEYIVSYDIRDLPFRTKIHYWFKLYVSGKGIRAIGCGLNYKKVFPREIEINLLTLRVELKCLKQAMRGVKNLNSDEIFLSGIYDTVLE